MIRLTLLCALAGLAAQTPTPGKTAAPAAAAQRPEPNPTVQHAAAVLDGLIREPRPRLVAADVRLWTEQLTWFKSIRARLQTLMTQVAASTKVTTPLPVDEKNIKALQEECETESRKFTALSNVLKTRHDVAMNAIRNMK